MKDLYPANLNPIETAIWAAEYVRVSALPLLVHHAVEHSREAIELAARSANQRVAQLREAREAAALTRQERHPNDPDKRKDEA